MNIGKYTQTYSEDLKLKGYSGNTIKNYVSQVDLFLRKFQEKHTKPSEINEKSIKDYLLQFKTRNSMCHALSALKLFYKMTIKQPMKLKHIEYPRSEKKLPQVIDKDFLLDRISKIENKKHKAIIALAFSTGLRVSEVINLKIEHFDLERNLINILNAKGRKDRVVPLSENVRLILREYWKECKPKVYEG